MLRSLLFPLVTAATLTPQIINGTVSTPAQDSTVMLYWLDRADNRLGGICTGSLVAPNLVLTARHCVSDSDETVACDPSGAATFGGNIHQNHDPQDLYVFTGVNRPAFAGDVAPDLDTTKWQPAGQGKQVIDDGSTNLCNHDIAFVLLQDPVANAQIASLQLDGAPKTGEKLLTVGWGVTIPQDEPSQRQQRNNVTLTRTGPSNLDPVLTPNEVLFDESICAGDSGAPLFVQSTNAILGVVSRGNNGKDPSVDGFAASCVGADNIATKLSAFKPFITSAFQTAGATPKVTAAPPDDDGGCAFAAPGTRSRAAWPLGLLALAFGVANRRRRAPSAS